MLHSITSFDVRHLTTEAHAKHQERVWLKLLLFWGVEGCWCQDRIVAYWHWEKTLRNIKNMLNGRPIHLAVRRPDTALLNFPMAYKRLPTNQAAMCDMINKTKVHISELLWDFWTIDCMISTSMVLVTTIWSYMLAGLYLLRTCHLLSQASCCTLGWRATEPTTSFKMSLLKLKLIVTTTCKGCLKKAFGNALKRRGYVYRVGLINSLTNQLECSACWGDTLQVKWFFKKLPRFFFFEHELDLQKVCLLVADGAPAMIGRVQGLVSP